MDIVRMIQKGWKVKVDGMYAWLVKLKMLVHHYETLCVCIHATYTMYYPMRIIGCVP